MHIKYLVHLLDGKWTSNIIYAIVKIISSMIPVSTATNHMVAATMSGPLLERNIYSS